MSDLKWPKADSPCFDPATNSLAILTKSMLSVKCLCSCLERSLSLAKFTFGEKHDLGLVRFIHDMRGFQNIRESH